MKNRILTLILLAFTAIAPLTAMDTGVVIDPLHYNGQFTITAFPKTSVTPTSVNNTVISNAPEVFKTQGIPVIISFACSKLPWWAITTGTGYVLIKQFDESASILYNALLNGSGYALGEITTEEIGSPSMHNTAQVVHTALMTSCAGIGYVCGYASLQTVACAALQAIGFSLCTEYMQKILSSSPTTNTNDLATLTSQERIQKILDAHPLDGYNVIIKPYLIAAGIIFGGAATATCVASGALSSYMSNVSLPASALLYEQAYRATKKGYAALKNTFITNSQLSSNQHTEQKSTK